MQTLDPFVNFAALVKNLLLTNLRVLNTNIIFFVKRESENVKLGDLVVISRFFYFNQELWVSRALILNMRVAFQNCSPKNPSKAFLVQHVALHKTLHFDKIESADFKYDNSSFKFLP